uniref:Uncharacterized protein n=1 Tax=Tetradesmus obliquus TaxID=3088 RepID=A0A383V1G3_TETOB|eukprot:jgi/Sobl393_1/2907/SZX59397.1
MANRGNMVPAQGQQAAPQQGPKPWVIWMLFGLGWVSLLFFGLSLIPFPAGVQWSLWASGWLFVACWWAGTVMGLSHKEDRRVKPAWTSCAIMAGLGTAIGAVPSLAAALYRNWYVIQSVLVAGLVVLALSAYSSTTEGAAAPAAGSEAAAGGEAAAGAGAGAAAAGAAAADGAAENEGEKEQ